jgi:hypothetical protein
MESPTDPPSADPSVEGDPADEVQIIEIDSDSDD